jgi:hypothetical protein
MTATPIADPEDLLAIYSFLPWLRQGVVNAIVAPPTGPRASIHVELQLAANPVDGSEVVSQTVAQDISLYGPGDIIGVDARNIVRTEPRQWTTNFESNYLPAVDFYAEDFPWRYTPAPAVGLQLTPWITLVVLKDDGVEFTEGKNIAGRPLPYITIPDVNVLPPAGDLWAWAHVHLNQSISPDPASELVSTDMNAVLPRIQAILGANPDLGYSRLICPRRLDVNTSYHVFVIPTFESGRLAGVGEDPSTAPGAMASAWASYAGKPAAADFPFYYRSFFRTGDRGDFRYLVSLLKPQPVDKTVGRRDFDVTDPGSNIPAISKPPQVNPALAGVLRMGGALQVPDADLNATDLADRQRYEDWDQPYPDPFQTSLAQFINLPDDYAEQTPGAANAATDLGPGVDDDPDPLITSPLYGCWHSLTQRLLTQRDGTPAPNSTNWVHRLNLDPRFRVPANYGAEIVEKNAEEYMNDAWQQIGDVLEANQRIRRLHFASAASLRLYDRHLMTVAADSSRVLALTAPVSSRVLLQGATVATVRPNTLVPPVLTSTVMRRLLRPGARLMRQLPFTGAITPTNLLERINSGAVASAPPKTIPAGVPTVDQAAGAAAAAAGPAAVLAWLKRVPRLPLVVLSGAIVLALILLLVLASFGGAVLATAIIGVGVYLHSVLKKWAARSAAVQGITEGGQTAASVATLPTSSNFVLSSPGSAFRPSMGGPDTATAVRFKKALVDSFNLTAAGNKAAQRPAPVALDMTAVSAAMIRAIDPQITIWRRGLSSIALPSWITDQIGADFNEVMAYPKIDLPMYKPLKEASVERLLPNINKIASNSITLMETNQRFVEAYMVGLNHEFARKLLWREYPTDQRGSYFRQFWETGDFIDSEGLNHDALKEKLYDIPEIHRWPVDSALGQHNNRADSKHPNDKQAVLIVRGELLKKYPNTVLFAQHAKIENGLRTPDWLTQAEEANPPLSKTRSPLFSAQPEDDIFFFGFDLTIDEVKGSNTDPGWYFVLQERPGEARFGLELTRAGDKETFDDLTWDDAMPGGKPGQFLPAGALANVILTQPSSAPADADKLLQFKDDEKIVVGAEVSSARWAYLLFRQPVMVAVHGSEMLSDSGP